MKKLGFGTMIRKAREDAELTREQAARKVGITPGYLGHLERETPVHLSEELAEKMVKKLGVPQKVLALAPRQNVRCAKVYRDRRNAKRKKRARSVSSHRNAA